MVAVTSILDSPAAITKLINSLRDLPSSPPFLYVDLEGIKLSRKGTISILSLFVPPQSHVYLIDIVVLGNDAFSTPGADEKTTLKSIRESPTITKVFFDVRNDSDALYAHFGIALQCIEDVQLMENGSRRPPSSKRLLNGLAKCIEDYAPINSEQKQIWKATKDKGVELFTPEKGGSYEVFNSRPLAEEIKAYCVQDVQFLPQLRKKYKDRLSSQWQQKVDTETRLRVELSQSPSYQPHGNHKVLGPWRNAWDHSNAPLKDFPGTEL